jgi:hypothetical protein
MVDIVHVKMAQSVLARVGREPSPEPSLEPSGGPERP